MARQLVLYTLQNWPEGAPLPVNRPAYNPVMLAFLLSTFTDINPSKDADALKALDAMLAKLTAVPTFAVAVTLLVVDKIGSASKPVPVDKTLTKEQRAEQQHARTTDFKFALWYRHCGVDSCRCHVCSCFLRLSLVSTFVVVIFTGSRWHWPLTLRRRPSLLRRHRVTDPQLA